MTHPLTGVAPVAANRTRRLNAFHRRLIAAAGYLEAHGYRVIPPDRLPDVEVKPFTIIRPR